MLEDLDLHSIADKQARELVSRLLNLLEDVVVAVDPARLPPDAVFKGYEDVVVQDVLFRTDHVLFRKEQFYSPSQHTTYVASLPPGYRGQFGPGIKSLALVFSSELDEIWNSVGKKAHPQWLWHAVDHHLTWSQ